MPLNPACLEISEIVVPQLREKCHSWRPSTHPDHKCGRMPMEEGLTRSGAAVVVVHTNGNKYGVFRPRGRQNFYMPKNLSKKTNAKKPMVMMSVVKKGTKKRRPKGE